jgi:hypothetical protein
MQLRDIRHNRPLGAHTKFDRICLVQVVGKRASHTVMTFADARTALSKDANLYIWAVQAVLVHDVWLRKHMEQERRTRSTALLRHTRTQQQWLDAGVVKRMLFVGGADAKYLWYTVALRKDRSSGVKAIDAAVVRPDLRDEVRANFDTERGTPHIDPHVCNKVSAWLQVDVFTSICSGFMCESKHNWTGRERLSSALRFVPSPHYLTPTMLAATACLGVVNFELFFHAPITTIAPWQLAHMVDLLMDAHAICGGRTDVRHGGADYALMFDVSIRTKQIQSYTTLVHHALNALLTEETPRRVAIHEGKYKSTLLTTALAISGFKRVRRGDLHTVCLNNLV